MSALKSYRHALTGKTGKYSDAVAKLFPELELIEAEPEAIFVPAETETVFEQPADGKGDSPRRNNKREVAY